MSAECIEKIIKKLKKVDTVLFDFDGVLMQSIEDHYRSWNVTFKPYDVEVLWNDFAVLEGQSLYTIAEQLCMKYGVSSQEAKKIATQKNETYLKTGTMNLYDGADTLLHFLCNKGFSIGLVTGAHRERFEKTVTRSFQKYFNTIVTADDVAQTKPHPEPFAKAAVELDKMPTRCVVVENAPLGIQSAKAAQMICLAVMTTLPAEFLHQADCVVKNLTEIKNIFERI